MLDINMWTFSGRLTKDATSKAIGNNGTTLVTCTVANNTGFGDNKACTFITVNIWGKMGQNLLPYLVKGKAVAVSGSAKLNKWLGQDGLQHTDLLVDAKDIVLLSDSAKSNYDETQPVTNTGHGNETVTF